jgi:hypothetical protein
MENKEAVLREWYEKVQLFAKDNRQSIWQDETETTPEKLIFGGWDWVVECVDFSDFLRDVEDYKITSYEQLVKKYQFISDLYADRDREAEMERKARMANRW